MKDLGSQAFIKLNSSFVFLADLLYTFEPY